MKARARSAVDPYRSQLERDYAARLELRLRAGEILAWHYEPESFVLGKRNRYLPDFRVVEKDGTICFVEVKGWSQSNAASRVKWKTAARLNPIYRFQWATKKKGGQWHHEWYD